MSATKTTKLNAEPGAVTPVAPTETALVLDEGYWGALENTDKGGDDNSPAYVGFYHKKSGEATKNAMEAAGAKLDTFYLVRNGSTIPLQDFKYHLLESTKFFTKQDGTGKVIGVSSKEVADPKFAEHGVALIVAKLPSGELVPARWTVRGPAYKALKNARQTWETAKDATKFGAMGESYAYAATANPFPVRFIATASASMQKSAASGNDYVNANCTTTASKKEEIERFIAAIKTPAFMQELTSVKKSYSGLVESLSKKIGS